MKKQTNYYMLKKTNKKTKLLYDARLLGHRV